MNQPCPLCNNENFTVIFKNVPQFTDSDVVRCNQCGHKYTITNKKIDVGKLYTDEVYKVVENRNSIFDMIIQREYNGVLQQLDKIRDHKGNLLDFGCGKGKFASLAMENGWNVKAVETSPDRATYARNVYGLDVNSEFYTTGSIFNIQFDVLSLFHVLEHLSQASVMIDQLVKDNVIAGGVLIVEVPNINSWQSMLAKENWLHLDVPRHIHHFSPDRLYKLLIDINLKPLKTTYFSFHLGVLGMVDSLLKRVGYRKNIIYELKNKKNKSLIILIAFLLPFAFFTERLASLFGKGGIIRMYVARK